MKHQHTLLRRRFDGHKAHGRARHGLADGLGIGGIVLPAFDIGLDVLGGHQADLVPKSNEFPCPVMRVAAGFNPNKTGFKLFEKCHYAPAC